MILPPFALYPEEKSWWSFNDYGAVLSVMRRLRPSAVLEFGPGSSTLALIEGGALAIDCCEDNPDWFAVYHERLELKYSQVTMQSYAWSDPVTVPGIGDRRYDLALIDGPHTTPKRPPVLEFCIARCAAVLICCEDFDSIGLRPTAIRAAEAHGMAMELLDTGPLSGSFALLTHQ